MPKKSRLSKEELVLVKEIIGQEQNNLESSRLILKKKSPSPYENKLRSISEKLSFI